MKNKNLQKFTLTTRYMYFRHKASNAFNRKIVELSVLPENGSRKYQLQREMRVSTV